MTEQSVPVLLTTGGTCSPAEPDLSVCSMSKLLVCYLPNLTRTRISVKCSPPPGTGCLLHDQKIFLFDPAHKISRHSGIIRNLRSTPDNVIIPGNKIQILPKIIVTDFRVEAHHIMSNEMSWRANFTDNFYLFVLESD